MVRILHTSDWHVGRRIRGNSRRDEHEAVLSEIVGIAVDQAVDLVVVAGDVFDVSVPPPWAEELVYATLVALAEQAPTLVVAGNHDHPGRLQAVAPLLRLGRVHTSTRVVPAADGGVMELPAIGVRALMLPWQSQRGIVTASDLMERGAAEHSQTYADRMRRIVEALSDGMTPDTVNIAVGHVTVHGADASGSERDVHTVRDYSVPASVFPGHLSYVALGHFHRQQPVANAAPTWYSGSPLQLDFGEHTDRKGVVLVDAEPGLPATMRSVPLESGRRLLRLVGTLPQIEEAAAAVGDAWVRVELDEPGRAGLADEVRRVVPGAVDVVLVRKEAPARTDDHPARLGRPRREVFAEYLDEQGIDDDRLLALFDELLEEVG